MTDLVKKLLPCPFCGGEATHRPDHYVIVRAHDKADCECPLDEYVTFPCTPELWNRRALLASEAREEPGFREAVAILREIAESGWVLSKQIQDAARSFIASFDKGGTP